MNTRIVVLGGGDVGSAVAHRLYLSGADVVLVDECAPSHPRRGMAFTDAWFDGAATLDGVVGLLVAEATDLSGQLGVVDAILCSTAATDAIVEVLRPDALVDARMRKRTVPEDSRALVPVVIGLGPGFTPGSNCSAAIETAWSDSLGAVLREQPTAQLAGEPRPLEGVGRERFVYAPQAGVWRTRARIGDRVATGHEIGVISGSAGACAIRAPLDGALRGLSHDGVSLRAGQKLLELDPRAESDTRGLGARPAAIARGVLRAVGLPHALDSAFFSFESSYAATMDCIPMSMRRKLDRCGLKVSLAQWRTLSKIVRETLVEASEVSPCHIDRLGDFLRRRREQAGWPSWPEVSPGAAEDERGTVPVVVRERCAAEGRSGISVTQWASLTALQRYALPKLAVQRSSRNWQEALAEFGLGRR